MNKIIKGVLVACFLTLTTLGVQASNEFEITEGSAVFSMEELESGNTLVYENYELNYTIEVVKEMVELNTISIETLNLQNSTYTISYKSLTENISYKVVVSNNGFTHVHSGTYSVVGYFVESSSLRLVSLKYATYSFVNKLLLKTWTSSLDARINSSNELVVTLN